MDADEDQRPSVAPVEHYELFVSNISYMTTNAEEHLLGRTDRLTTVAEHRLSTDDVKHLAARAKTKGWRTHFLPASDRELIRDWPMSFSSTRACEGVPKVVTTKSKKDDQATISTIVIVAVVVVVVVVAGSRT